MGNCVTKSTPAEAGLSGPAVAVAEHYTALCADAHVATSETVLQWLQSAATDYDKINLGNISELGAVDEKHLSFLLRALRLGASGITRAFHARMDSSALTSVIAQYILTAPASAVSDLIAERLTPITAHEAIEAITKRPEISSLELRYMDMSICVDGPVIESLIRSLVRMTSLRTLSFSLDVLPFRFTDPEIGELALQEEPDTDSLAEVDTDEPGGVAQPIRAGLQKLVQAAVSASGTRGVAALQLGRCGLRGVGGARVPLAALLYGQSLSRLEVRDNALGPAGFATLARALKENRTLRSLVLYGCLGRAEGVDSVCAGVLEHPELVELDLGDNEADDDGALSIAYLISHNKLLQTLRFAHNLVGNGGMSIAKGLRMNNTLAELDLSGNHFNARFPMALASVLSANVGLRRLNLTDCFLDIGPNLQLAVEANRTLERLDVARGNYADKATLAAIDAATARNRSERRREPPAGSSVPELRGTGRGGGDALDETESLGSSFARRLTVGGLIEERVFDEPEPGDTASLRTGESASMVR